MMADQNKQIGGAPFHVGDCCIWAAIFYLDSATDYRECLGRDSARLCSLACGDLIMLDSVEQGPISRISQGLAPGWTLSFVFLLIAGMTLYLIWYL
jgi:hypothetical protein